MKAPRFNVKTCMVQEDDGKFVSQASYQALYELAEQMLKTLEGFDSVATFISVQVDAPDFREKLRDL